jgi:hypothetical protein
MEYLEGLYTGFCTKRGRGLCGGCPWCKTEGVYVHKKVTFPGSVTFLPRAHHLRAWYKTEFANVPGYNQLHAAGRPEVMTLTMCIQSANDVLTAKSESKAEEKRVRKIRPYVDHDVFTTKTPGYNKLDGTLVDPYHEFGNLIDDMRCLWFNIEKTGQHWKKSRREAEHVFKRFEQYKGTLAGWHVKEESIVRVRKLLLTLKTPIGWPDLKAFCVLKYGKKKYMKLSERIAFIAHRGLYIIGMYI